MSSQDLFSTLAPLTSMLRSLNQQLRSAAPADVPSLVEFREALDTIRLTAWTVHEQSMARRAGEGPLDLAALAAQERAKRFGEMLFNICADVDAGHLDREAARALLANGLQQLRERLFQGEEEPVL